MADVEFRAQERALALRTEALEICDRFAWHPQCIGSGSFEAGVREIYAELRLLQKVRAVHVSQELIDCCRRHRQWFPLLEDVQARIWMFLGDRERAEQPWQDLLLHSSPLVRELAQKALTNLEKKKLTGELLATDVAQSLDRNQTERAHALGRCPVACGRRVAPRVAGSEIKLHTAEQKLGLAVVERELLNKYGAVDTLADTGNEHFLRFAVIQELQPVIQPLLPSRHHDDAVGEL